MEANTTLRAADNPRAIGLVFDHMKAKHTKSLAGRDRPHSPDERVAAFSLDYLSAFGYLAKNIGSWSDVSLGDIVAAFKDFQSFFGLSPTGEVSVPTVRAMEMPRCGCPDITHSEESRKVRDFAAVNLPAWRKRGLRYKVTDYLPSLAKEDVDAAVAAAFGAWAQYVELDIRPAGVGDAIDVTIGTGRGAQSNFDGAGGTLAWCYLPNGNDQQLACKLDLDETWVTTPAQRGIVLLNVLTHELGHSLGLDHSRLSTALMAPFYSPAIGVPQQQDDVPRVVARYGARTTVIPPVTPPVTPPAAPGKTRITLEVDGTVTGARVVV